MSLRSPVPLNVSSYIEAGDGEVEDMACGATFTLALTTNGTPYQWGMLNGAQAEDGRWCWAVAQKSVSLMGLWCCWPGVCRPCVPNASPPHLGHPSPLRSAGMWSQARHGAHGGRLRHELG